MPSDGVQERESMCCFGFLDVFGAAAADTFNAAVIYFKAVKCEPLSSGLGL